MSKRADGSYSPAWRRASKIILWPLIQVGMKHEWHGQDNISSIPADQGIILAINHLSYADIFADSLFAYEAGRYPVFLAKSSLFDIKVLGSVIRQLGQLPVYRGQADAALVLKDAEQGLRDGACIIFYPEATVTRDPDQWPMVAKTGVARLALLDPEGTPLAILSISERSAVVAFPSGQGGRHARPAGSASTGLVRLAGFILPGSPLDGGVQPQRPRGFGQILAGVRGGGG